MELKIVCQCGQKYKFDVEPAGGRMPFSVNCPVCQADGTATANMRLAEHFRFVPPPPSPNAPAQFAPIGSAAPAMAAPPPPPPPPPPPTQPVGGLRINREMPATSAPAPVPQAGTAGGPPPPPAAVIKPLATVKNSQPKVQGEFSLVRGIIGAIVGSAVGSALLYGFSVWAQFRFPLMGVATGVAAGYTARLLARGTDTTLGIITAVIASASVAGTLVLIYDGFPVLNIVSVVVAASVAYRVTSG